MCSSWRACKNLKVLSTAWLDSLQLGDGCAAVDLATSQTEMSSDSDLEEKVAVTATGGFPTENSAVEFGWTDDQTLAGRRAKAAKDRRQKLKPGSFETLGLSVEVLRGIKRKGYRLPTPIQRKTLPLILQGQDVVGMARTGSGKTAAFVIPMLERLKEHSLKAGARAVLLAPTRELTLQTHKVVKELGRHTNLRTAVLVGGDSMEAQFAELAANPDIIVATPGRLMHHLKEVEGMSLRTVEFCVFDEADRLFEMGFAAQLREILSKMGSQRQTLLFSATMPSALHEFAKAGLRDPEMVRLDVESRISPDLGLAFFSVRAEEKIAALLWLLQEVIPAGQPTLVFASTRHHVEMLHTLLEGEGVAAACVYGAMDQAARKIHVGKFSAGRAHVMVVTDVAARGIDIPLLDNVVNFDFPPKPKLFVHRVGRAARAGRTGTAYSLLTRDELPYALDLHLFLSRPLVPAPMQSLQQAAAAAETMDPQASMYGTFPQAALEDSIERVRELFASKTELQGLHKACSNAFGLYKRTRPGAAAESVSRAKGMLQEGIHPLLAKHVPVTAISGLEAQAGIADIARALKAFRPAQTVLEAQLAPARRGEGAGSTSVPGLTAALGPDGGFVDVMAQKRSQHQSAIQSRKRKRTVLEGDGAANTASDPFYAKPAGTRAIKLQDAGSEEQDLSGDEAEGSDGEDDSVLEAFADPAAVEAQRRAAIQASTSDEGLAVSGRFQDPGFFLGYERGGNRYLEDGLAVGKGDDMVLDIAADDREGLSGQKKNFHWDKRRKRYVQLQPGEQVTAGKRIRVESGARSKGKDAPSGLYQKWAKSQKRKVPGAGARVDDAGAPDRYSKDLANRFKKGGRGWSNPEKVNRKGSADAKAKAELRTPQQVRKERKLAEQRKARSQGRQPGFKAQAMAQDGPERPQFRKGGSTKYGGAGSKAAPKLGRKGGAGKASDGKAQAGRGKAPRPPSGQARKEMMKRSAAKRGRGKR